MVVAMLCQACKIVEGQRYSKRLNDKQITSLLKFSCQRPQEQEAEILQVCIFNSWLYPCFLKQKPLKSKNWVLTAFILRGQFFSFPFHIPLSCPEITPKTSLVKCLLEFSESNQTFRTCQKMILNFPICFCMQIENDFKSSHFLTFLHFPSENTKNKNGSEN